MMKDEKNEGEGRGNYALYIQPTWKMSHPITRKEIMTNQEADKSRMTNQDADKSRMTNHDK